MPTVSSNFHPRFSLTDEAANFTKEDLKVSSALRINSQLPDLGKVLLLVPMNATSIGSFLELGNQSKILSDEIQSEVCLSKENPTPAKRSVIKLRDFGFKSSENDAIADCATNSGNSCLRLQEIDAPSKLRT